MSRRRISTYDTVVWIKKLKDIGLTKFTRSDIPDELFKHGEFMRAFRQGFIYQDETYNAGPRRGKRWVIDDNKLYAWRNKV